MTKEHIRAHLKDLYDQEDLSTYVSEALAVMETEQLFKDCAQLLVYAPDKRYEIPFVELLLEQLPPTISVFFPRIHDEQLIFYKADYESLEQGSFGLLEPSEDAETWIPSMHQACILVPALGATLKGVRIGRGKGCYDRFLATHAKDIAKTISVMPEFAVLSELPKEPHDIDVDVVLSIKT